MLPPDGTLERSPEKEEILGLVVITLLMMRMGMTIGNDMHFDEAMQCLMVLE